MTTFLKKLASLFGDGSSRDVLPVSSPHRRVTRSTAGVDAIPTHSPVLGGPDDSITPGNPDSSMFSYPPPRNNYDYVPNDFPSSSTPPSATRPNSVLSPLSPRNRTQSPILPLHNDPHSPGTPAYPPLHITWARLKAWLNREYTELGDTLNYGIQPAVISGVQLELGLPLPTSVRESYLICDGQEVESSAGCSEGLFFGLTLLPLEDVLEEWRFWREVDEDPQTGANERLRGAMKSIPEGYIRREYSCRGWLPLVTDRAGNYLGVDLHPDEKGSYGQVIVFGRDFDTKVVMWKGDGEGGWARWLAQFVEDLESREGYELGPANDGSDGSEDEIGYESYFSGPNGAGAESGNGPNGLRLTGDYKGWNVLEAWADKSVKRWIEAGLYTAEVLQPPQVPSKAGEIDITDPSIASGNSPISRVGQPLLADVDTKATLSVNQASSSSSNATTPTTPRPVTSVQPPTISITLPPVPQPVPLPTPRDFMEGSPPTSSSNSPEINGAEGSKEPMLNDASQLPIRQSARMASEDSDYYQGSATTPLVGDTSFDVTAETSMTEATLIAPAAPVVSPSENGASTAASTTHDTSLPSPIKPATSAANDESSTSRGADSKPLPKIAKSNTFSDTYSSPTKSGLADGVQSLNEETEQPSPSLPSIPSLTAGEEAKNAAMTKSPNSTADDAASIERPGTPSSIKSTSSRVSKLVKKAGKKGDGKEKEKEKEKEKVKDKEKDRESTSSKRNSAFGLRGLVQGGHGKKKERTSSSSKGSAVEVAMTS